MSKEVKKPISEVKRVYRGYCNFLDKHTNANELEKAQVAENETIRELKGESSYGY